MTMKTRRASMFEQDTDKAPVTFHDVAACFSEEEWKLLQHWQQELYKNVMNEIHQALISLGPLIATSVFSLRPNEKEDMCLADHQNSEIRHSVMPSPGLPFHSIEVEPSLRDYHGTKREESITFCSSGPDVTTPHTPFSINEEGEAYPIDIQDNMRRESINNSADFVVVAPVIQFNIKEEEEGESFSVAHQDCEHREIVNSPTGGIKGYEDQHLKDAQGTDGMGSSDYLSTGDGSMKKKRNFENSLKCNDKVPPCKAPTGKVKAKFVRRSDEQTQSISQMWSENDPELRGVKTTIWQSCLNQPACSNLHMKTPYVQRSDIHSQCESTMGIVNIPPCEANTLHSLSPYTYPESEQKFTQDDSQVRHQETHTLKGQFTCIECEKSFSSMSKLIKHERTHTGERPYHCTVCGKSFSVKGILIRHQKIHTGEKPYQCMVCKTSFNQKEVLIRHQKIHTGERPYQCPECGKCFSQKGTLNRHQIIHMKEKTI